MPQKLSNYLKINSEVFASTGAFDSFLDVDTRLFVDPFLIANSTALEFHDARKKVLSRFANVAKLLQHTKSQTDASWKSAARLFTFREIPGFGLGYAKKTTQGSGIGPKLRKRYSDPNLIETTLKLL